MALVNVKHHTTNTMVIASYAKSMDAFHVNHKLLVNNVILQNNLNHRQMEMFAIVYQTHIKLTITSPV